MTKAQQPAMNPAAQLDAEMNALFDTASVSETPPQETPPVEPQVAVPVETPPAESQVAAPPEPSPVETPPQPDQTTMLRESLEAMQQQNAQLAEQNQQLMQRLETSMQPPTPPDTPDSMLDDNHRQSLQFAQENHPELFRAMDARERMQAWHIAEALRKQEQRIVDWLKPYLEIIQSTAATARDAAVVGTNQDYLQIRPQLVAWVEKQSPFLKRAYQAALDRGEAADINELVQLWRASGQQAQPPAPTAAPVTPPGAPAAPAPQSQLAGMHAVTPGRQTAPARTVDPNDIEAAFRDATAEFR